MLMITQEELPKNFQNNIYNCECVKLEPNLSIFFQIFRTNKLCKVWISKI